MYLAKLTRDLPKMQAVDSKSFERCAFRRWQKTRGEKMKVSVIMLLKTNGSKMSESGLAILSMKTQNLPGACHYVTENK
jgi:hypothetical protein